MTAACRELVGYPDPFYVGAFHIEELIDANWLEAKVGIETTASRARRISALLVHQAEDCSMEHRRRLDRSVVPAFLS